MKYSVSFRATLVAFSFYWLLDEFRVDDYFCAPKHLPHSVGRGSGHCVGTPWGENILLLRGISSVQNGPPNIIINSSKGLTLHLFMKLRPDLSVVLFDYIHQCPVPA